MKVFRTIKLTCHNSLIEVKGYKRLCVVHLCCLCCIRTPFKLAMAKLDAPV